MAARELHDLDPRAAPTNPARGRRAAQARNDAGLPVRCSNLARPAGHLALSVAVPVPRPRRVLAPAWCRQGVRQAPDACGRQPRCRTPRLPWRTRPHRADLGPRDASRDGRDAGEDDVGGACPRLSRFATRRRSGHPGGGETDRPSSSTSSSSGAEHRGSPDHSPSSWSRRRLSRPHLRASPRRPRFE
jgi:hypothetical protein